MPAIWGAAAIGGLSAIGGFAASRKKAKELKRLRRLMERKLRFAKKRWRHYQDVYGGLEKLMVADAMQGPTVDYERLTRRADADVTGEFDRQQGEQRRRMMAYGLNPNSGRFVSSDRMMGLEEAAASAEAQNNTRESTRRWAEDTSYNRRAQLGRFGAGMIANAERSVMQSMDSLGRNYEAMAQNYGGLADNLFATAGQMGGLALSQAFTAAGPVAAAGSEAIDTYEPPEYGFDAGPSYDPGDFNLGASDFDRALYNYDGGALNLNMTRGGGLDMPYSMR